jgi:acyl-CoA synthetase (NDP forming)
MTVPDFKYLFEPRSVAFVGASSNVMKSGGMFMNSLLKDNYTGVIYPVNPKEQEIMGLKCYSSLSDIDEEIDLAVLTVPAQSILSVVEECARKKVKFAIVHAAGFGEMGADGKEMERKMVEIAHESDLRLVGPNCMGIYSSRGRLNTIVPHIRLLHTPGGVAFVGQSGWSSEVMVQSGTIRGLRFSGVISIGNQCDIKVEDLLEYWGRDPNTNVIAAYVEGLKDARRFMEVARKVCPYKPVLILKGGRSELGAKSTASHTGSMAVNYDVFQSMCRQTGIIEANSLDDLIDLAVAFSCPVLPGGNRMGLLVDAGGTAVVALDAGTKAGLTLPRLPAAVERNVANYLTNKVPLSANRNNPVDLVWTPIFDGPEIYANCLGFMLPEVDVCLLIGYAFLVDEQFRSRLIELRDRFKKPIVFAAGNPSDQIEGIGLAASEGLPAYLMPDNAVRCIAAMVKRAEFLQKIPSQA